MEKQPLLNDGATSNYGGGEGALPSQPMAMPNGPRSADPPPPPSLPSADLLGDVSVLGYEGVTFQGGDCVRPPTYDEAVNLDAAPPTAPPPPPPTHVSNEQAREALSELASDNFCWGSKAARQMTISSISSSSGFHYQLDTFTESRKSAWKFEPYIGQPIDGPFNGPAPSPWSIPVQPETMFRNHQKKLEVPHTACVKPCHDCSGSGRRCCHSCHGNGRVPCNWCNGSGHQTQIHAGNHHHHHDHHHHGHHHHDHHHHSHRTHVDLVLCHHCAGAGNKLCYVCGGCGQVNCNTCDAHCQLRCFIQLTVAWRVHSSDHIVESAALPNSLIRSAGGKITFEESRVRVPPVTNYPNPSVNDGSRRLVEQHATAFPNEQILMQRHKIRVIPISEVVSDYNGSPFTYWVYGTTNTAYAPDYPQQCCCGCTIL